MDESHELAQIAAKLNSDRPITKGTWFGLPCLKVNGIVFAASWRSDIAVKLPHNALARALRIDGARLFDPRQQGHPLKE